MYTIKKIGAMYCVILASNGLVQYRSSNRNYCMEWLEINGPKE